MIPQQGSPLGFARRQEVPHLSKGQAGRLSAAYPHRQRQILLRIAPMPQRVAHRNEDALVLPMAQHMGREPELARRLADRLAFRST